ncbi:hypothetical protein AB0F45_14970 [Streptomyces achromogenes]|uniref:hypothetical protein n=1 Tax=Streptomyces achromogenes TaxID=67255 RepID=UPI0033F3295C
MAEPLVDWRLGQAYPEWYLPPVYVLVVPETSRWDDPCPRMSVASDEHGWTSWPAQAHLGLVCATPPWADRAAWEEHAKTEAVLRQREGWSPDHWVTGATGDDQPVGQLRHLAAKLSFASTVSVVAADGDVWVSLQTRADGHGVLIRLTTDPGTDHSPLARALYAPAVYRWYTQWHTQSGHRARITPLEKRPVPWPQAIELTGPEAAPARIRLQDVIPVRLC